MADATFDPNIDINIILDALPVDTVDFGVPLIAGTTMGAGFTERVRRYPDADAAAADTDLSAGLIARVSNAFAQTLAPNEVAVGRVDGETTDDWNVAITSPGAASDTHTVTILGEDFVYTTPGGEANADIVDGLIALIGASSLPVSTVDNGDDFDIQGTNPGEPLGVLYAATGSAAGTATNTSPAVTLFDELSAVEAEDGDWYGLALETRDYWSILEAARWVEPRTKLLSAQSSDSNILDAGDTDDVVSDLAGLTRLKTFISYHSDDNEYADVAWIASLAAVNPDTNATIAAYKTLIGVTPNAITSTQKNTILSKGGNVYLTLKGVGSTGDGKVAGGEFIDVIITRDWLQERLEEDVAQLLLNTSNRGEKVPYTNQGFNLFGDIVEQRLDQGEAVGHFVPETGDVDLVALADVSNADRTARRYTFSFSVDPAGAVQFPTINGAITIAT